MRVSRFKTLQLIEQTKGKMFACEFVKKDGSKRKMVARLGVHKNLKGGRNGASEKNTYLTVFDMVANGYRMINLETLLNLKIEGITYEVV